MFYPEIPTAEEIKALRVKHGLENYQAAALINVSLQTWWRYENGDLKPSVLNWALFLNAVGELVLPPENPLTPFAFRALSFVPPVALKSGNAPESYVAPTPEQITKLREEAKLSRSQCNELFGFKSSTHWGKFERGEIVMAEREWVIFQVALKKINPPAFSDFDTAKGKTPSYSKPTKYVAPTPDEIRAFLAANDLTQEDAAAIIGLNPRTFRRYLGGAKPAQMAELTWKYLQRYVKTDVLDLPDNPDNSKMVKLGEVHSDDDFQAALNEFAVQLDKTKKQNKKRRSEMLPVLEPQFTIKTGDSEAGIFCRLPDYLNGHWSMWKGYEMSNERLNKMLAALSKRFDVLNIKFK